MANADVDHKNHLSAATGIRGLACLVVLVGHSLAMNVPETWQYLRGVPKIGVWLFFVLSAFLLTRQFLLKSFSLSLLVDYGISRFLRIFPAYIFAVLVYYLFEVAVIKSQQDLISALLLEKGFAHLWTIPVEVKFYFFVPVLCFLFFIFSKFFSLFTFLFVSCFLTGFVLYWFPWWKTPENTLQLGYYFGVFLMGSLAAWLHTRKGLFSLPESRMDIFSIAMLLVLVLIVVLSKFGVFGDAENFLMDKQIMFGLLFSVFLYFTIGQHTKLSKIFDTIWLLSIGKWSYSIYLFHWIVVVKISQLKADGISGALIAIFLSIFVGWIGYKLVEVPMLALRKKAFNVLF